MDDPILERLAQAPLVFDGAMGTMLYNRGVFINACFDELNLTKPEIVKAVHDDYVAAGVDVIETNTFGANRVKLRAFGLAERVADINRAGVDLARQAAGSDVYVVASVGPCLKPGQPWRPSLAEDLEDVFREQIAALLEAGVDGIVLETFSHPEELLVAARVAHDGARAVFGSIVAGEDGQTLLGVPAVEALVLLDRSEDIDVVGLNCGIGPGPLYDAVEAALGRLSKPMLVMPNAGLPKEVEGRMIYMSSPEYFTSYAKKLIQIGVRAVGGCCGTTPEHLRMAGKAIRSLSGVKKHIQVVAAPANGNPEIEVIPASAKSRFANRLLAGKQVSSVELLPPKSCDLSGFLNKARMCHYHGVDAINIPDGPRASSRISPTIAAVELLRQVGIEPILHYCCRDRNLIGMQSDLLGGYSAGLRNMLIITGDPPKLGDYPDATGVFDVDSIGLTQVASNLNHGMDIGGNPIQPPTGIFIGVGANPCALSLDTEIGRFCEKVQAGAEFAITQPVFDAEAFLRFLDRIHELGADLPMVAGVWPLVSYKNAEFMRNEVPGVEVPDAVMARMAACETKEDAVKTGIEIARDIREKIADVVAGYQVSAPFGRVEIALEVLA